MSKLSSTLQSARFYKRISQLETAVQQLQSSNVQLQSQLNQLKGKQTMADTRLDQLEQAFAVIQPAMDEFSTALDNIRTDEETLKKQVVDLQNSPPTGLSSTDSARLDAITQSALNIASSMGTARDKAKAIADAIPDAPAAPATPPTPPVDPNPPTPPDPNNA